MSRKLKRLEAEYNLAKLEAEFSVKKATVGVTHEDKMALRQLRHDYRSNHRVPVSDGAQPVPIKGSIWQKFINAVAGE